MFSELLSSWRKGAGHKYIRRKPYLDKRGRRRYRYTYQAQRGGGVTSSEAMVEGAAFRLTHNGQAGHFHVESVDGDRLKIRHDESGGELELSRGEFQRLLHLEHGEALGRAADRAEATLKQAKKTGTKKQIKRAEAEARKLREIAERGKEPEAKPEPAPEIELTRDRGKARRRFDENHERLRKLEAQIRDQKSVLSINLPPENKRRAEQRLKSLIEEKRSLEAENKKILSSPEPEPAPIVRSEDEQRNAREFQANAEEIKGLDAKIKEAEERIARRGVGATVKREARKEIKGLTATRKYLVASNKRILAGEKRSSTGARSGEELVPYVPVSWKEAQSPEAAAKALILSEFSGVSDDAERFRGYLDQATSGKISSSEALSVVFEELSKKIDVGELYDKISEAKGKEFAEQALAPYLDKKALVRVYTEVQPFIRTYADATISELKQQAKDLEKREAQYRDEDLPPEQKKMLLDHTRRLRLEVAVQLGEAGVRETKEERTPKTRSGRPSAQYKLPGGGRVEIRQDQDDNRIRLFFPGKPSDDQRARLKKRGFRWSPRAGAWQRQLTENAVIASGSVLRAMGAELVKEAP